MSDKKISALTSATTPLAGTEVAPIVQSNTTVKATVESIATATQPSGTANGVMYLNGSKVPTTGSALVFNGSNLGVGTSSPSTILDVVSANQIRHQFTGAAAGFTIGQYNSNGDASISNGANANLLFATSNAERMRIDNLGNLGLGVAPSNWSGGGNIEIKNIGSVVAQGPYILLGANYYYNGGYKYATSAQVSYYSQEIGSHKWYTAASGTAGNTISFTQVGEFDASGNFKVNNGNVIVGTSGKGIDFSADGQAAGMTSELLDDYEEGTFTVSATFGGGNTGMDLSSSSGIYTKVGRVVSVQIRLYIAAKGSSTGALVIGGLPFAISGNAATFAVAPGPAANMVGVPSALGVSTDQISVYQTPIATGSLTAYTDAEISNGGFFFISGSYVVA